MSRIRDVWAPNLETEMANIRDLIEEYPYIAMVRPSLLRVLLVPPAHTLCYGAALHIGHRVSRGGRATNRGIQDILGLPLPNHAV